MSYMGAERVNGGGCLNMLMVGAVVLFYSAKVHKMGVLVGFMHDYRPH